MAMDETQAAFAAALTDPTLSPPPGVTTVWGVADQARFAVYRNNVTVSLVAALKARFPVTARLVGDAFFRMMARDYVAARKPASPLLFEYGDDFPECIAACAAAAPVPHLPDIASVEVAWSRAYHAAEATPLDLRELVALSPETVLSARLARHPATAIVRSIHPVGSIWAVHQGDAIKPVTDWRGEDVLVVRPGAEIGVHILPPEDADFVAAVMTGSTIGAAGEAAAIANPSFDIGRALSGLVRLGAVTGIRLGGQERAQ